MVDAEACWVRSSPGVRTREPSSAKGPPRRRDDAGAPPPTTLAEALLATRLRNHGTSDIMLYLARLTSAMLAETVVNLVPTPTCAPMTLPTVLVASQMLPGRGRGLLITCCSEAMRLMTLAPRPAL